MVRATGGTTASIGIEASGSRRRMYRHKARRDGSAPDEILAAAKEQAAGAGTVIVVGRSRHTAGHPAGSVPTRLLHHSPYPVTVIP